MTVSWRYLFILLCGIFFFISQHASANADKIDSDTEDPHKVT